MEYAVIEDRGVQYKVQVGETVQIDLMDGEDGSQQAFDKVLMVSREGDVKVGRPYVDGAKVQAVLVGTIKGDKVITFKNRRKNSSVTRTGHRQSYSQIKIEKICATADES